MSQYITFITFVSAKSLMMKSLQDILQYMSRMFS